MIASMNAALVMSVCMYILTHQLAMADSSSSFAALLTSALCLSEDILHKHTHTIIKSSATIMVPLTHPISFPSWSKEHFLPLRKETQVVGKKILY